MICFLFLFLGISVWMARKIFFHLWYFISSKIFHIQYVSTLTCHSKSPSLCCVRRQISLICNLVTCFIISTPIARLVDTLLSWCVCECISPGCRKPVINYHYFTASILSTNHAHVPLFSQQQRRPFFIRRWLQFLPYSLHPKGKISLPLVLLQQHQQYIISYLSSTTTTTTLKTSSHWREMFISQLLYIFCFMAKARHPSAIDNLGKGY